MDPKTCTEIQIKQASIDTRVDAIGERLDEVLEELRGFKRWLTTWGSGCFGLMLLYSLAGKDIVSKVAVTVIDHYFGK